MSENLEKRIEVLETEFNKLAAFTTNVVMIMVEGLVAVKAVPKHVKVKLTKIRDTYQKNLKLKMEELMQQHKNNQVQLITEEEPPENNLENK